jgi:hypothetical protein
MPEDSVNVTTPIVHLMIRTYRVFRHGKEMNEQYTLYYFMCLLMIRYVLVLFKHHHG